MIKYFKPAQTVKDWASISQRGLQVRKMGEMDLNNEKLRKTDNGKHVSEKLRPGQHGNWAKLIAIST